MGAVSATIEGSELVIRLPIEEPKPSASGKTLIVASTHGTVGAVGLVGGKSVKLTVSAWVKAGGVNAD